ncbi:SDR family oxidoreductase [uncultured Gimesia sp.]|uniref:SDR family NAD(P)-dependent oxidoreductase n=1 Tax=uncultured Gimesia sp. TaxID=1678688 RepID=UPI0026304721|nr:SDR family oxidoreductase [uncultured Gimesia sp.]
MSVSSFCDLSGMKALVTGSSSGIGKAIAVALAEGGADVLVHYRNSAGEAQAVVQQIQERGRKSAVISADLSNQENYSAFIESAFQEWGALDIWVNNAGVDLLTGADSKLEYGHKLEKLFEVDVRGTVLLSREVGQRMQQQGTGCILNIGWDQSDRGMEGDSGELFAASKNAIMGFSRSLAVSLAPDVRVNCIAPGWILTAWGGKASEFWQERVRQETPMKCWGKPEDIANMARFLCSHEAAYITGQVINVNGGAVR